MGILAQSVKENAIIRRQKTEQKRDISKVQLAIKEIINKLRKEKTWQKISVDVICREYDIPAQLRYVFLHDFESNPNILSKPAQNSTDKTKIADSIPMEYKYVPKKEKQRLKYTANCFKLIQTDTLDLFRERLDKYKDDVPIYDKLIILNELLRYEANKGFKRLSIYAILGKVGMTITDFIKAMDSLYDSKILVLKDIKNVNAGVTFVCRIIQNEKSFKIINALKLKNPPQEVNPMKKNPRTKKHETKRKENPIKARFREIAEERKEKEAKRIKALSDLNLENLNLKDEIKTLNCELEEQKEIQQKLVDYNNDFEGFCLDQLMVFLAKLAKMIENEEKINPQLKKQLQNIRKQLVILGEDYTNELLSYNH